MLHASGDGSLNNHITNHPTTTNSNNKLDTKTTTTTTNNNQLIMASNSSLQCPLCKLPFDNASHEPKLLSCHHSFCLNCLMQHSEGRQTFRCPTQDCRKKIAVPTKGPETFPTNFYISQVRDLVAPNSGTNNQSGTTCEKHLNQPLLFFCETCTVAICMNCTVLDHKETNGHKIVDISAAVQVHHEMLNSKMSEVDAALGEHKETMIHLRRELRNLEVVKEMAAEQITETFRQLRSVLDQREAALTKLVDQHYQDHKQAVIAEAQQHKAHGEQLNQLREAMLSSMKDSTVNDSIQAANNVQLMGKIGDLCQERPLQLPDSGFIQFRSGRGVKGFLNAIGSMGEVQCRLALPSVVAIETGGAISSLKSMIKVTIQSCQGAELNNYPITAAITDPCGDTLPSMVTHLEGGYHVVEYRPQMPGKHQMQLKFANKPMWGTEQEISVKSNNPVMKIGAIQGNARMHHPTSVAVNPTNGNVYVADMGNKRVQIYSPAGQLTEQFKIGGSKATTYDIALNAATEELYCTKVAPDETGHVRGSTIRCFSLNGEPKHHFTNPEMRKALFLTVNSKGHIIASDSTSDCLYIYSKEGNILKKIGGKPGNRAGEFNFPSALCSGKDDTIIVLDTGNHRVQVFSKSGKFQHQFGVEGHKKGQFKSPRGVAADQHGNVLVADSQNRIQVLKHDGTFVSCIDSSRDKINDPYNMCVTNDGHVLVADFKNDCVKKYRYM